MHGIRGEPVYAAGAGFDPATRTGRFQLAPDSPGAGAGRPIPNFSDGSAGEAPDVGAHQRLRSPGPLRHRRQAAMNGVANVRSTRRWRCGTAGGGTRTAGCCLHTPYYIIVGEFLIAVAIGYLATSTRSGRWSRSLAAGVLAGLAIFACYAVSFRAIEGWR